MARNVAYIEGIRDSSSAKQASFIASGAYSASGASNLAQKGRIGRRNQPLLVWRALRVAGIDDVGYSPRMQSR